MLWSLVTSKGLILWIQWTTDFKEEQESKLRRHREKCSHRWRRYKSKSYNGTVEGIHARAGSTLRHPRAQLYYSDICRRERTIEKRKVVPTWPEFWCLKKQGSRGRRGKVYRDLKKKKVRQTYFMMRSIYTATTTTKSLQSCPTLCDPTDSSPPGPAVPGIL